MTGPVLEDGGDEDEAIAALLHDAAEDPGGRARCNDARSIVRDYRTEGHALWERFANKTAARSAPKRGRDPSPTRPRRSAINKVFTRARSSAVWLMPAVGAT